jgi:hypothetical protein
MKGNEYAKIIAHLKLTKVGAADFLNVDYSTSKRWMSGMHPIPHAVAMLLRVMIKNNLTVADVLALMGRTR